MLTEGFMETNQWNSSNKFSTYRKDLAIRLVVENVSRPYYSIIVVFFFFVAKG